jgi:hypothetical protein
VGSYVLEAQDARINSECGSGPPRSHPEASWRRARPDDACRCGGSTRKLHMRWRVTSRQAGASGEPLEADDESRAVQKLA